MYGKKKELNTLKTKHKGFSIQELKRLCGDKKFKWIQSDIKH